jgi:two-component system OmpR family response regulator
LLTRILVVDDERTLSELVTAVILAMGDMEVAVATNGREALAMAIADPPALIVSDVAMPDMDGLELCREVRATPSLAATPVLLLTARDRAQDKYQGFLGGADDYLLKPFDPLELQLRVKALLRRSVVAPVSGPAVPALAAGPVVLDANRLIARVDDVGIPLTASEFSIIRYMVEHPDRIVSVEELLTKALDYPAGVGSPAVIHTHIRNLRTKIKSAGASPAFLSSSRMGYMLGASNSGAEGTLDPL